MRLNSAGEFFECIHYSRLANSLSYKTIGITFRAKVIVDVNKNLIQPIVGLVSNSVKLTLYSTNLPVEIKTDDKIFFNGEEYMVDFVGIVQSNVPQILGASRFKSKFLNTKLPKVLGLK